METLETKSYASVDTKSQSSGSGGCGNSQPYSLYQNSKDNVKVVIRVRPLNEREKGKIDHIILI